jgi:hypothetical protein
MSYIWGHPVIYICGLLLNVKKNRGRGAKTDETTLSILGVQNIGAVTNWWFCSGTSSRVSSIGCQYPAELSSRSFCWYTNVLMVLHQHTWRTFSLCINHIGLCVQRMGCCWRSHVAGWLPVETGPLLVLHHACGTNCNRNFVPAKVSLLSRGTWKHSSVRRYPNCHVT